MNNASTAYNPITRTVNGAGWSVREMNIDAPAGWIWVSAALQTFQEARAEMLRMPPDASVDRQVYERLVERAA